jgi:hypothetical protein
MTGRHFNVTSRTTLFTPSQYISVGWCVDTNSLHRLFKWCYNSYPWIFTCASLTLHVLFYEGVSKSFRTGRLERELQIVQLSATRCSCIAILWFSLVSFAAITLRVDSQRVFIVISIYIVIDSGRKFLVTPSYFLIAQEHLRYGIALAVSRERWRDGCNSDSYATAWRKSHSA